MLFFSHIASLIRRRGIARALVLMPPLLLLGVPAGEAAEFRRRDEIPVPEAIAVQYTRQEWLDVITRVLFLGMSRTGTCRICYGGVLRVASDKSGPGGEVNVVYYRGDAPEGGNGHCKDGTAFTIDESELRFYERFSALKERAVRSMQERVARAAADSGAAGEAFERAGHDLDVGAVRAIGANQFVTSADARGRPAALASPVRFGEKCKLCVSTSEDYGRFKVVKGLVPYLDPHTRQAKTAVVWEYWSGVVVGGTASGEWRECSRETWFVEPDFVGATLQVMGGLFEDHAIEQMSRLVAEIEAVPAR